MKWFASSVFWKASIVCSPRTLAIVLVVGYVYSGILIDHGDN